VEKQKNVGMEERATTNKTPGDRDKQVRVDKRYFSRAIKGATHE
jgi:hypothetical protein